MRRVDSVLFNQIYISAGSHLQPIQWRVREGNIEDILLIVLKEHASGLSRVDTQGNRSGPLHKVHRVYFIICQRWMGTVGLLQPHISSYLDGEEVGQIASIVGQAGEGGGERSSTNSPVDRGNLSEGPIDGLQQQEQ